MTACLPLSGSDGRLPLPTLLSQALVAFTIEFDNEAEHRMPHRTTNYRSTPGSLHAPWLVSLVMWSNCMQFVGEAGVTVRELERLARTTTNLNGMQRWGYIVVAPEPTDSRPKPPRSDWVIRATAGGRMAQEVWRPLFGDIEQRWRERFGSDEVDRLRESLRAVASRFDFVLPDCLPILGYGLFSRVPDHERQPPAGHEDGMDSRLPLSALLARVLLAFTIEFEREPDLSLAITANVVRVLDEKGVQVRDLPLLTGISKEAISVSTGFLQKHGYALVESAPAPNRGKFVRLIAKGRAAQDFYHQLLGLIEERWHARFGADVIRALREPLERLVGQPAAQTSPLFLGLEPYPDGWRASVRKPDMLPHYPMVLHRGGFPDGS